MVVWNGVVWCRYGSPRRDEETAGVRGYKATKQTKNNIKQDYTKQNRRVNNKTNEGRKRRPRHATGSCSSEDSEEEAGLSFSTYADEWRLLPLGGVVRPTPLPLPFLTLDGARQKTKQTNEQTKKKRRKLRMSEKKKGLRTHAEQIIYR